MRYPLLAAILLAATLPVMADDDDNPNKRFTPNNRPGHGSSHVVNDQSQIQQLGRALKQAAIPSGNGINYHGGPVMINTVTVYYVWYGNWNGNTGVTLLESFARNLGGSPYFNINTTYSDATGAPVKNNVIFGGSTVDNYSLGTSLSDAQIWQIVSSAITAGKFPSDPNAVYFVLTSKDVNATSGFCSQYCGWHTYNTLNNVPIKYSFVGDGARCPSGCTAQASNSPNGNVGADGMASVIAHELSETVSDPQLNAWWDSSGEENGDKCAWTFGVTSAAPNGSRYNVTLGPNNYLIQQMWVNSGGGSCTMQYVLPTIARLTPSTGSLGASVPVTLTGENFAPGANLAISGAGVTTSNLHVVSSTQITATLTMASNADIGAHNVSVTQGPAVSDPVTFSVAPAGFSLTKLDSATGAVGATVSVTLTGTNFKAGASVAVSGTGITASNVKVVGPTQMTASLVLASSTAPGNYSVTVVEGGISSNALVFTATSTAPILSGLTPASLSPGGSAKITLVGSNFTPAATVNVSGTGITVSGITFVNATQLTAYFAVAANATAGTRAVTVAAGSATSQPAAFTVTPAPTLSSVTPNAAPAGTTRKITLNGTNFTSNTPVAVSGSGVSINTIAAVSATQITANLVIDKTAAPGSRTITVGANTSGVTFTILPTPTLTQIAPSTSVPGATTGVTLTGTNFAAGATLTIGGAGVTANSVTVVSATQITANFVVEAGAAAGARSVTVTSSGATTSAGLFNVTSAPPALSSMSPASAGAGSIVSVTLTGTGFTAGNAVLVSGSGVTVSNVTIVSPTQMTAQFVIGTSAAPGARSVTVSYGSATTAAVPFTITAAVPVPALARLDKTTGAAGSTLNVTATGNNFAPGNTLIFSGKGISVTNTRIVSPTTLTATLAIASTATTGVRYVIVSSGTTAGAPTPLTFTITAPTTDKPTVSSMSPSTGVLGSALVATLTGTGFTPGSTAITGDPNIPIVETAFVSPTQLRVVLGLGGAVGSHALFVTTNGTTASGVSAAVTYVITAPASPASARPPVASATRVRPRSGE